MQSPLEKVWQKRAGLPSPPSDTATWADVRDGLMQLLAAIGPEGIQPGTQAEGLGTDRVFLIVCIGQPDADYDPPTYICRRFADPIDLAEES